ncbi:MAG: nitroreductase family protein [Syntrophaceae bacterium]|nr:nitroreductase family protein [Syntrophaceae bacterium]
MPHAINLETCKKCGLCAEVCPNQIMEWAPEKEPGFRPDRLSLCIGCGHCMAVCPTQSITAGGMSYAKDFFDLPVGGLGESDFFNFLSSRRSVRNFQDKPVPREMLQRILDAIAFAPMGFPPHKIEVTVVQNRTIIHKALPQMMKLYGDLNRWMKNPLVRFLMKRKMNPETFNTIQNHVIPAMEKGLPEMKERGRDIFTRGAPALILFHAPRGSENHTEDSHIAVSYGLLAAHALGLGASAIGLIPPAVERNKNLRRLFQIPDDNEVLASMIVGYPKNPFKRGIRRGLARVTWVEPNG